MFFFCARLSSCRVARLLLRVTCDRVHTGFQYYLFTFELISSSFFFLTLPHIGHQLKAVLLVQRGQGKELTQAAFKVSCIYY